MPDYITRRQAHRCGFWEGMMIMGCIALCGYLALAYFGPHECRQSHTYTAKDGK